MVASATSRPSADPSRVQRLDLLQPPDLGGPRGQPPRGQMWHDLSLTIHKLNFLGWAGHLLGVILGLALMTLAVSGAWMFLSLYKQRHKAGLAGLFW